MSAIDDPRLTAVALGELSEEAVEGLADDAALRDEVAAISAAAGQIGDALRDEEAARLSAEQRAALRLYWEPMPPVPRPTRWWRPLSWAVIAACLGFVTVTVGAMYMPTFTMASAIGPRGGVTRVKGADAPPRPPVVRPAPAPDDPAADPRLPWYTTPPVGFVEGGVNRVILATDGDFNVGATDRNALIRQVRSAADAGIPLTTLGFGMDGLRPGRLEAMADHADGNYAYIGTLEDAQKALSDELDGALYTVARDVKVQVAFDPAAVERYRLIGYDNRRLAATDFTDDALDAGEIGAGHSVVALYEFAPAPGAEGAPMEVRLRYQPPDGGEVVAFDFPARDLGLSMGEASADMRFAAGVAAFGMWLIDDPLKGEIDLELAYTLTSAGLGEDPRGLRRAHLELLRRARLLVE